MSRIGKQLIKIPEGVNVTVDNGLVKISGPKGNLELKVAKGVSVKVDAGNIQVEINKVTKSLSSLYGTTRALLQNMVSGVKEGWSKKLELVGTGYRAEVSGNTLTMQIGYSHPVKIPAPEGISFEVVKNEITITGSDKEVVGQVAADIRGVRPPEPYKGKGIKYKGEVIRRKAGKAAKAAGA